MTRSAPILTKVEVIFGWFPLVLAVVIAFLMPTWRKGEEIMDKVRREVRQSSEAFMEQMKADPPFRIPGSAVVVGRMATGVRLALTHNLKLNHVLHRKVFLVAVEMAHRPHVSDQDRVKVTPISDCLTRVELRFGFMEAPDVPTGLAVAAAQGKIAENDLESVTYYPAFAG
jgi:KUP system potassium uptake protein